MMFTGLVQTVGRLVEISMQGDAGQLVLNAKWSAELRLGESIAVNGACLTLVEFSGERLVFDVLRETFEKTALKDKRSGSPLNLERALCVGDSVGGHWVSGHVDGTGVVQRIEMVGRDKVLVVAAPHLIDELIPKGSIAVDGVSLTLVDVAQAGGVFSVHVIPHTWEHTAFQSLAVGGRVNVETDLIGKYVRNCVAKKCDAPSPISWEQLRAAGFLG